MPPIPPAASQGRTPFQGHETWYRITGGERASLPPLVILHGGPGALHDYTLRFAHLASPERAVIHYDQLGCGRSTHLPDAPASFWTPALFMAELDNLLAALGIGTAYHLLGQSWGGMLAAEFAIRQPAGLRGLVIANSPPSMQLWVQEANRLREALPKDVQATLLRHEQAGTTSSAEYEAATQVFYARHVCRVQPFPDEVAASFAGIAADPTVYHIMNGPSEFHCTGSLKTWTVIDQLHHITAPTLLLSGRYDEATPSVVRPFYDGIKNASWHIFGHSSHMPHVEETDACMAVVGAFLAGLD